MKNFTKVLLTCFVSLMAVNANAALINGSLAIGGAYDATGGADLSNATLLTLDTVGANGASGDIALFVDGTTPAGTGGSVSLDAFSPVNSFVTIGGWQLDLTSLTIDDQTAGVLNLSGAGRLSGNGFDVTDATWSFSSQSLTSYSMTVTAVPVPAAVWLFGSGLIGLAGIARRKV